jgi:regulation of enolase protein 1 (concanavalin A-like superfamily)
MNPKGGTVMNTLASPKSCALVAVVILLVIVATVPASGIGPRSEESKHGIEEGTDKFSFFAFDDFDGKLGLNWQPVRHDPTHLSLSKNPGKLTITTQRGSIHGEEQKDAFGEGIQAKNILLIDNPLSKDMDFVATTCVSGFTPVAPYQQAGLIVYNDDDNYIKWGYEYNWPEGEGQVLCILSETDAKSTFRYVESPSGLRRYWLRLTKRGTRYEYAFSTDGKEFKVHGDKEWGDGSPKQIGILARNGGNKQAAELDARFEFFELRSPAPVPIEVTGTITIDGKPLIIGKITFHRDNGQFVGSKVKDGKYKVDHVPAGILTVTFEGKDVPVRYASEATTGLVVEVVGEGPNRFTFDLTTP